jgi:NAD(P)-dependent dehydrogenase (short-subunit alcohol dehydrogenase family)
LLLAKPFTDYTSGDFDLLVSTILAGFFYVSQSAAKQMLRQQSGHTMQRSSRVKCFTLTAARMLENGNQ